MAEARRSRTDARAARRFVWGFIALGGAAALSCRAIPPRRPDPSVLPPLPKGWPPPSAYVSEATAPANRWFHRAFSTAAVPPELASAPPARPLPRVAIESPASIAEISALLESLAQPEERALLSEDAARVLEADLLAAAGRWSLAGPPQDAVLARGALRAACLLSAPEHALAAGEASDPFALPPPLRTGTWYELHHPLPETLRPRPFDYRTTRIVYEGVSSSGDSAVPATLATAERALLLRELIVLDATREPVRSGRFNEAWLVDVAPREPSFTVFLFDRALAVAGLDPWIPFEMDTELEIVDPGTGEQRSGTVAVLCGSCHSPAVPFRTDRANARGIEAFHATGGEPVAPLPLAEAAGRCGGDLSAALRPPAPDSKEHAVEVDLPSGEANRAERSHEE